MKKIVAFLFVIIAVVLCSIPCFAESVEHNVYAKYVESDANCSRGIVKDGKASVTLQNGIIVTVNGIPADDYVLYVKEIADTEKTAMRWFSQCLSKEYEVIYPFDICLMSENGRIELSNDVDIQIIFPKLHIDKIFFINTDGNVVISNYANKNNIISFKSKLNAYCVMIPEEDQPLSPQTGDNSHLYLWCIISTGSLFCLVFLLTRRRRKDEEA